MAQAKQVEPFDWHRILWSEDAPPAFLGEVALRCAITYLLVLGVLRLTGRRGVRQLSIFELSIILALGSAAGDAMFYSDVPLTHIAVVFLVVGLMYVGFNFLTEKSVRFSDWLEGATICLIDEGRIEMQAFSKQNLTQKELFGELRQHQVEHLGQVRKLYMEATGNVSVYFYPDEEVRPGLPIWPELLKKAQLEITAAGPYACSVCGYTHELTPGKHTCAVCQNQHWLPSSTAKRQA
ncbi:DUF421 domain-containing protein [Hymenobacter crusticola]|uniref:YetF C-terminal domain-containing protein n=1 Tax=Hymenobacter crusticola TaxID=1770526 RepID=A0A243W9U4_9BACT|nr:YetF domain-containing protein [Hymenobacter crusticola]OUJ72001.1 hypothetical protein BXP70_20355 [Hymenobacter crusticola]